MCQNCYLITGDAADLDQPHGNALAPSNALALGGAAASAAPTSLSVATIAPNILVSTELSNFAKKVVAKDNILDIYLHSSGATVTVGGGSFGSQQINPLPISQDLQKFIQDSLIRLDSLIDLDFRFTTSKDTADLDFFVDSTISLGGTGTTLGIALSNSSANRNWWEIVLNGPALQSQSDYLCYATIHEFGHTLGLEHPFDNSDGDYYGSTSSAASAFPEDTVMAYRSPQGSSWPTWYSTNDINALVSIWGVESTPVAVAAPVATTPATPVASVAAMNSPVYRFYNSQNGEHFYTASAGEKDVLLGQFASVFSYEGVAFNAPVQGDQALYRFCRPGTSQHLFTASNSERDALIADPKSGYTYEGAVCNVYTAASAPLGATAVFGFLDPGSGQYFYTASAAERAAVASGVPAWKDQGAKFFI